MAWEPGYRVARMAHGPLVEALVAQGELVAADAALTTAGLDGDLTDSYMLNFVLFARGKLRLAQGRNAEGIADLEELGRRETKWRGQQPRRLPVPLAARPRRRARRRAIWPPRSCELARAWGAAGALGRALRVHGLVTGDLDRLRESVDVLDGSPWRLEHAHSLIELGAAIRRDGHRTAAREPLHAGMELAHACAAEPLVARARAELLATGARPRRMAAAGSTPSPPPSAGSPTWPPTGMTNRQIAQALFVTSANRRGPPHPRLPEARHHLPGTATSAPHRRSAMSTRAIRPDVPPRAISAARSDRSSV